MSNRELKSMFTMMDASRTGEIAYSEFIGALFQTRINMHEDLLRDAFDRFDQGKKGKITGTDLAQILGDDGFGGLSAEQVLKGSGVNVADGIDFGAFMRIMTSDD